MARLAVIVVTYNSIHDIDGCLGSLTAALPHISHEIVVVDNASSDGTAGHVRKAWPAVRLIETEHYLKQKTAAVPDFVR